MENEAENMIFWILFIFIAVIVAFMVLETPIGKQLTAQTKVSMLLAAGKAIEKSAGA